MSAQDLEVTRGMEVQAVDKAAAAMAFTLYSDVETSESENEHPDTPARIEQQEQGQHMQEVTPELLTEVAKQVEFYFSDANLPTDKKLLKQIRKDIHGFVPIKMFSNFRKIRALTKEADIISLALKDREGLVLSADGKHVRRTEPVPEYNIADIQRRILVVEELAAGYSIDSMSEMFSEYGPIQVVRICSKENKGKLPGWMTAGCMQTSQQCAFVEYAEEEDAAKAAAAVYTEDDRRFKLKINRLTTVQQLHPQPAAVAASWRDEPHRSRAAGATPGSARNSREVSPMSSRIVNHSRLQHSPGGAGMGGAGNRPLGRRSTEHPATAAAAAAPVRDRSSLERRSLDPVHGQRPAAGSSAGAADSSDVWGHGGFHPSDARYTQKRGPHVHDAAVHKPLTNRLSRESAGGVRHPAEAADHHSAGKEQHHANAWHAAEPLVSVPTLSDGVGPVEARHAAAAAAAAYTPPSRRPAEAPRGQGHGDSPESAGAGAAGQEDKAACVEPLSPATPVAGSGTEAAEGHKGSTPAAAAVAAGPRLSYALAAASGLCSGSGAASPALSPTSPKRSPPPPEPHLHPGAEQHPPAASAPSPANSSPFAPLNPSPHAGAKAAVAAKGTTSAAINAMLADVMAVAELKQKEMDAAAATKLPPPADAPDLPATTAVPSLHSLHLSEAAAPPRASTRSSAPVSRGGSRGTSPTPSSMDVDHLIHKILVSPTKRCATPPNNNGGDAAAKAPAAPRSGAEPSDPSVVGSLINKILADMPSAPSAAPAQALAADAEQPADGREEEDMIDIHSSSPATSLGRQLSVVPEGNEFARVMSAQLVGEESFVSATGPSSSLERELSLAVKDLEGSLAMPAAGEGEGEGGAYSLAEAESVTLDALANGPASAETPPRPLPLSKPPLPGSSGRASADASRLKALRGTETEAEVEIVRGGSSSSGDAEEQEERGNESGEATGEGGKAARRRRSRRSRRKSAMSGGGEGGGEGTAGAGGATSDAGRGDDAPRQRRASSGNSAQRRLSDGGPAADGRKEAGVGGGAGADAKAVKKHTKKDYASWAAATPEYRAEAAAYHGSGGGSAGGAPAKCPASPPPPHLRRTTSPAPSPPRSHRPLDFVGAPGHAHGHGDGHAHGAQASRGPDGSRGFAMGRGKPLAPPAL